ncbi:MAG: porin family protein [Alistipes sp.]|nr:porin family protein [Alistipes sp.]MDE6779349.1 porin family protein [Alistipes sp.]
MIKKIFFAISLLLMTAGAAAQERGKFGLGPKLGAYVNTGGAAVFGLGAEVRYNISDPLRIAPSIMWLSNDGCSVEVSVDWHYMFRVAPRWHLYPLAGVSVNDIRGWKFGVDVGLGTDYAVGKHMDLSGGVKWLAEFADCRNPIVIFFGATFKF